MRAEPFAGWSPDGRSEWVEARLARVCMRTLRAQNRMNGFKRPDGSKSLTLWIVLGRDDASFPWGMVGRFTSRAEATQAARKWIDDTEARCAEKRLG